MTRPILHRQSGYWCKSSTYMAMPLIAARAGRPTARAVLHRLGYTAPIAIAIFAATYFYVEMLRAVLS